MKVLTIANDKWELNLFKTNRDAVFMNPNQNTAKENLVDYLAACRSANSEESFLILCNDFDTTTFLTLCKILEQLGLEEQSLILFGISGYEINAIHSLQRRKNLGFFRAIYAKSYWNIVGNLNVKI